MSREQTNPCLAFGRGKVFCITLPRDDKCANTAFCYINMDLFQRTTYSREMCKRLGDDFDLVLQKIVNLVVYFNEVANRSLGLANLDDRAFRAFFSRVQPGR